MFTIIVAQLCKMIIIMAVGYLAFRCKLIDQKGNQTLATLLLYVVTPILAVMCQQIEFQTRLIHGLLIAYVLAILTHVAAILVSVFLVRKKGNPAWEIERFIVVYSNCGFLGIPLVRSVLGVEGVFYLTAYITVFNIFSWTHGLLLMQGKATLQDLKKGLTSPMVIAALIGLILFFARIRFPQVLADGLNYVGDMNTPLAMLIAGISVAQVDLKAIFHTPRILYICFLRLVVVPALMIAAMLLFRGRVEQIVLLTILIAAACPAGATCTTFALRFNKDFRYASELYSISTVLSLFTMPLFVTLGSHVL